MGTFVLHTLSKAINTYLDLDPVSKQRLKKLHNKILTINLLPFQFTFQCVFHDTDLHLKTGEMLVANAKIIGTPLQMLSAMMEKTHRQRFFAQDLKIEGEAEFAQEVIALFDKIHIDWEDHLAQFVGDVPAYRFNRLLKKTKSFLTYAEKSLSQDINEYIHEEAQWLPSRLALQDFFDDIDNLRMDTDRLEARLKLLKMISEDDR